MSTLPGHEPLHDGARWEFSSAWRVVSYLPTCTTSPRTSTASPGLSLKQK